MAHLIKKTQLYYIWIVQRLPECLIKELRILKDLEKFNPYCCQYKIFQLCSDKSNPEGQQHTPKNSSG